MKPKKSRADYQRARRAAGKDAEGPRRIIAIDGEGYTTKKGEHRYTYLAACDESKLIAAVERKSGLTFEDVADLLLKLPQGALVVGYSLG